MKLNNKELIKFVLNGVTEMSNSENFSGDIDIKIKVHCGGVTEVNISNSFKLKIPSSKKNGKNILV